jgi:two-component system sensor histidine kinase BaeS
VRRLFVRTLLAFLAALLLLAGLQTAAWFWGLLRSQSAWSQARSEAAAITARRILRGDPSLDLAEVPADPPLAVYDPEGELVFSNRGFRAGRGAGAEPHPVVDGGDLLGFYRTGRMQFQADAANQRFAESLRRAFWIGAPASLLIALAAALVFSRALSRPAARVAQGLEGIARGELQTRVSEQGAEEIARIAGSANRLAGQLEREREIRRRWVQDIAHDLRTPVAALRAQLEAMRDGVLELSLPRMTRSLGQLERVETLILDLEELMQLESPELRLELADLPAARLLDELRETFALALRQKRVEWQQECTLETLRGDPKLLRRALTNLLSNAVRHVPEGGAIRVAAVDSARGPELRVANTGTPIPDGERERVFDRLYRGEYARSTPGSGLGLTIARRVAQLHGGDIRIDDWDGRGTQFRVALSAAPTAPA